jgi:hypothetical protein
MLVAGAGPDVEMVRTDVTAEPLVTGTGVGLNAQEGAGVTAGVIALQERVTVPV